MPVDYGAPINRHPPRQERHVFPWVFMAVQALFLVWIVSGLIDATDNCEAEIGSALDACEAGTAAGAGIGVVLIVVLWAAVDVILGVCYMIFREKG